MRPSVLGLDIGGANVKAAHTCGVALSEPFALWRDPGKLDRVLDQLLARMPRFERLAVTMTGELCDCFASKREGVQLILDSVIGRSNSVWIWTNQGKFVEPEQARRQPYEVASANWLALATFVGRNRLSPYQGGLLVDIGTTTTDLIPLLQHLPVPRGRTDSERLLTGELLYQGWKRTPLCALSEYGQAAEWFATMHDVCLVLQLKPEDPTDRDTADGRPATRENAHRRLARMRCEDLETSREADRLALAEQFFDVFRRRFVRSYYRSLARIYGSKFGVVVAGSGADLFKRLMADETLEACQVSVTYLHEELGEAISTAACAYAVAVLAQDAEG